MEWSDRFLATTKKIYNMIAISLQRKKNMKEVIAMESIQLQSMNRFGVSRRCFSEKDNP